jgi:predicted MPP superfamily phosphohydrolase
LQLSGHVHGGQIFPFGLFTWLTYRVPMGMSQVAPATWLYVSYGSGTWGPPIRFWAPPEVTVIDIVPERDTGSLSHDT